MISNIRKFFFGKGGKGSANPKTLAVSRFQTVPTGDSILLKISKSRSDLRQILADDEIASAIATRREALLATSWQLESTYKDIQTLNDKMSRHITQIISAAFESLLYGYSLFEVIYRDEEDGGVGVEKIVRLPLEEFALKEDGLWYYKDAEIAEEDLRYKLFITVHQASATNPTGESLLSLLYYPWYIKQHVTGYWLRYMERHANPILVGKTDAAQGYHESDPNNPLKLLADSLLTVHQSNVATLSLDDELEVIDPSGRGGDQFERLYDVLRKRIYIAVLGQTLTTDASSGGSYAAAKVSDGVRDDKRHADIRLVSPTVQRVVDIICDLNNITDPVRFVMGHERRLEADRAERDARLVQAGVLTLTEQYLKRAYDFEDGDFVIGVSQPSPQGNSSSMSAHEADSFEFAQKKSMELDVVGLTIDSVVQDALNAGLSPVDIEKLKEMLSVANSTFDVDKIIREIAATYPKSSIVTAFEAGMSKAIYTSSVVAYVNTSIIDNVIGKAETAKELANAIIAAKPDLIKVGLLIPERAIALAKERGVVLPEKYYGKLEGVARAESFSIAGISNIEVLTDVKKSLTDAMQNQVTFQKWKKEMLESGKLDLPKDRLNNIYRTNLIGHYARANCERIKQHAERKPFLRYMATLDGRTRPAHRALNGRIWEAKDTVPFMPPNGYRCRCTVHQLWPDQAEKFGGVTKEPIPAGSVDQGWDYSPCDAKDTIANELKQKIDDLERAMK